MNFDECVKELQEVFERERRREGGNDGEEMGGGKEREG